MEVDGECRVPILDQLIIVEGLNVGRYFQSFARAWLEHNDARLALLKPLRINRKGSAQPIVAKAGDPLLKFRKSGTHTNFPLVQVSRVYHAIQSISERRTAERTKEFSKPRNTCGFGRDTPFGATPRIARKAALEGLKHQRSPIVTLLITVPGGIFLICC